MFIKEIIKKNKGSANTYTSHRLMESYRSEKGPRQRIVLSLGKLTLKKDDWKMLADRIEEVASGQRTLFKTSEEIEVLAQHYAQLLVHKRMTKTPAIDKPVTSEYVTVDLNSLKNSTIRTIGAESVGYSVFKELGLDKCLKDNGFTDTQIKLAAVSIIGKLVNPGSERNTRNWVHNTSGLCELIDLDPLLLSNNSLYRISDRLLSVKDHIEKHLNQRERDIFNLNDKILLYDLTNTYFEGTATNNKKAKRGRSKEKRSDCPLLTLGLVLDGSGFPRVSKLLPGNISDGETLIDMIQALQQEEVSLGLKPKTDRRGITVVLDAGIAVEKNLSILKNNGYDYIVVARNKPVPFTDIDSNNLTTIKDKGDDKVEGVLIELESENVLYCKSAKRLAKETAMENQYRKRFEEDIKLIAGSLSKKRGIKKYEKVIERIGRLKERYKGISRFYIISIKQKDGKATSITWQYRKKEAEKDKFSGSYFLRSSRKDLNETELWQTYVLLTKVEEGFRCLKDELNLRPIFHHKQNRSDGHLFITVLAYHLLNAIRVRLSSADINMRWKRVRDFLSNHSIVTTTLTSKTGQTISTRKCSEPEAFQRQIYRAMRMKLTPLAMKRTVL